MVCERASWGAQTAGESGIIADSSTTAVLSVVFSVCGERPGGSLYLHICKCRSVEVSVVPLNSKVLEQGFKTFWDQIPLLETKSQGSFIQNKNIHLSIQKQTSDSVCSFRGSRRSRSLSTNPLRRVILNYILSVLLYYYFAYTLHTVTCSFPVGDSPVGMRKD